MVPECDDSGLQMIRDVQVVVVCGDIPGILFCSGGKNCWAATVVSRLSCISVSQQPVCNW